MEKIFVPIDFSPLTDNAVEFALQLALQHEYDLVLFHAFFNQIYFTDDGFQNWFESNVMLTEEIIKDFYIQKKENLETLKSGLEARIAASGKTGIRVTAHIESGEPEHQILSQAREVQPVLIIMGSSGIGKRQFLAGSITRKIIEQSGTPVLVVPEEAQFKEFRRIVYMTAFDEADRNALLKVYSLFKSSEISIHCLHLNMEGKSSKCRVQMSRMLDDKELMDKNITLSGDVVDCHDPRNVLEPYLRTHEIDLVTYIPHKRTLIQAIFGPEITKKDLVQSSVPILSIP